jgi:hypothetical protein
MLLLFWKLYIIFWCGKLFSFFVVVYILFRGSLDVQERYKELVVIKKKKKWLNCFRESVYKKVSFKRAILRRSKLNPTVLLRAPLLKINQDPSTTINNNTEENRILLPSPSNTIDSLSRYVNEFIFYIFNVTLPNQTLKFVRLM